MESNVDILLIAHHVYLFNELCQSFFNDLVHRQEGILLFSHHLPTVDNNLSSFTSKVACCNLETSIARIWKYRMTACSSVGFSTLKAM